MDEPIAADLAAEMVRLASVIPGFARGLWEGAILCGVIGQPNVDPLLSRCLRAALEAGHWPCGVNVVDAMMTRVDS